MGEKSDNRRDGGADDGRNFIAYDHYSCTSLLVMKLFNGKMMMEMTMN